MDEVEKKRGKPAHDPFAPPPEDLAEIPLATDDGRSTARNHDHGAMFDAPSDGDELKLDDETPRKQLGNDAFAPPPEVAADLRLEEHEKKPKPRNPLVERMEREKAPRAGCTCRKHYDVYLDNDFGAMATWIGGGFGLVMLTLLVWGGPYFALSVGLFGATCGGIATVFSIALRCEGCRKKVTDLTTEERDWVKRGRAQVIKYTAMFGVFAVAAITKWLWFL